jgi:hypothetical protein
MSSPNNPVANTILEVIGLTHLRLKIDKLYDLLDALDKDGRPESLEAAKEVRARLGRCELCTESAHIYHGLTFLGLM